MSGRAAGANSAVLQGTTETRSYQITLSLKGNGLTMQYAATMLDSVGRYTGQATFTLAARGDSQNATIAISLGLTKRMVSEKSDLRAACRAEFGPTSVVGDWNDLVAAVTLGGKAILDSVGLLPRTNALLTYNGQTIWQGDRHYAVDRHEGNKPSDYLAHADFGGNLLSLGSWHDMSLRVLCKGR